MIMTVTFNPSLDYIVRVKGLQIGSVNRTQSEELYPGGKGINVSIVLKNLGVENCAVGFTAGFTGEEIERRVASYGCRTEFIRLPKGFSRINVKIKGEKESEINGQGPQIPQEALQCLYEKLDGLTQGDILVLAGSIPNTLPENIYEDLCRRLAGRGVRIVVDATRDLLMNVLPFHPFFIKPNKQELGDAFGVTLQSIDDVVFYAKKMQEKGAQNVLVSMAAEGAVLAADDGRIFQSLPPDGKVVNSVGAGDSMVAGFLAGYLATGDYQKALQTGLAAGSASAFSEWLATKEEIDALL